jgi:hypothetical protein
MTILAFFAGPILVAVVLWVASSYWDFSPRVPPLRSKRVDTGDDAYDATMKRVAAIFGSQCGVDPDYIHPQDNLRIKLIRACGATDLNDVMDLFYEDLCSHLRMRQTERSYEDFMACETVHDVVMLVGDPIPPLSYPPLAHLG